MSIGFKDPFFYYYRCTYIANPIRIAPISLNKMKEDIIFKDLPIVRKNMQGINGFEIMPSVYNYLLDISDVDLKRIYYFKNNNNIKISREKDVENLLIKPLLKALGYNKEDYIQQLYIEIGNHNYALIPDFVVNPILITGHYSAKLIIEAKLSISTNKLLDQAKNQARSYAKLLNAKYILLASIEGLWLCSRTDDYTNNILNFSWSELQEVDVFKQLLNIIGKDIKDCLL